jgi:hypothetical protein
MKKSSHGPFARNSVSQSGFWRKGSLPEAGYPKGWLFSGGLSAGPGPGRGVRSYCPEGVEGPATLIPGGYGQRGLRRGRFGPRHAKSTGPAFGCSRQMARRGTRACQ